MKKVILVVLGVMGVSIAPWYALALPWNVGDPVVVSLSFSVSADPMDKWDDIGGWGGLFTVRNTNTGAQIQTFCLELDEWVVGGSIVQDVSDDEAYGGGRNTDVGDQLSDATKWLYYMYTENPSNWNVKALQIAIWVLEQEYYDKNDFDWSYWDSVGSTAKSYYDQALNQSTTADIRVLDLLGPTGSPAQSYLIRVPEPATLGMLGLGLLGFAVASRRIRRKR